MKYTIARSARPQVTTLLIATLISVVLWFIPFADVLAYPFRIFVTFIHEGGHALAALLTGNSVHSLNVAMDGSGEVYSTSGGLFSNMLISSAGYLGAMTFGALLLVLIRRTVAARYVLFGSAAIVGVLTIIFGLIAPIFHIALPGLFTLVSGAILTGALVAAGRYLAPRGANFLVAFLAIQCVLNAVFDLKTVLFMSSMSAGAQTDATNMAAATGLPAFLWVFVWIAIAFMILSLALRAYAVRGGEASQPDLPFEDDVIL